MTDLTGQTLGPTAASPGDAPRIYDRRSLTYSNTFDSATKRAVIRGVEWMTGMRTILRRLRQFERMGVPIGQAFWRQTMVVMNIDLLTPDSELAESRGPDRWCWSRTTRTGWSTG